MKSHNPDRPSYRTSTQAQYKAFYERIQSTFSPEEMTPENLAEWLRSDDHPFIGVFANVKDVYDLIEKSRDLEELKALKDEISSLPTHRSELREALSEKISVIIEEEKITRSIALAQKLADERNINLSEKTFSRVVDVWGRNKKSAVVIWGRRGILGWRYL